MLPPAIFALSMPFVIGLPNLEHPRLNLLLVIIPVQNCTKLVVDEDYIAKVALKPLNITQLIVRPRKSTHKFPSMSLVMVANLVEGLSWTVVVPIRTNALKVQHRVAIIFHQ